MAAMKRNSRRIQTRLVAAGALVIASFISAFVLSTLANQKVPIWSATKVLVPGHLLAAQDLIEVRVTLGQVNDLYISTQEDPIGSVVKRQVRAGELIPRSTLTLSESELQTTAVPISIHASDLPSDVASGEIVNLYHVGDSTLTQNIGPPVLILSHVFLLAIDKKGQTLGGDISLTVSVAASEILSLLNATSSGRIVVVKVNG